APHQREGRVLRAIDADGEDLSAREMGDDAWSFIDLHQGAGAGDAAFRKDDDLAAALQAVGERLERHRIGRIDRQEVEELEGGLHPPPISDMRIDGEMTALRQEGGNERPIEEGGMIGDDERLASGLGEILEPLDLDAIKEAEEAPCHIGREL